eukprot:jgi/Botrbrau1/969/Bobra.114_1s0011.2
MQIPVTCNRGLFLGYQTECRLPRPAPIMQQRVLKSGLPMVPSNASCILRELDGLALETSTACTSKSNGLRSEFLGSRRASLCSYSWRCPSGRAIRASTSNCVTPGSPRPARQQRLHIDLRTDLPGREEKDALPRRGRGKGEASHDHALNGHKINGHSFRELDGGPLADSHLNGQTLHQPHLGPTEHHRRNDQALPSHEHLLNGSPREVHLSTASESDQAPGIPKKKTPEELERDLQRLADKLKEVQVERSRADDARKQAEEKSAAYELELLEKEAELEEVKRLFQEHIKNDRERWKQLAEAEREAEKQRLLEEEAAEEAAKKEEAARKKRFWPFQKSASGSELPAGSTTSTPSEHGKMSSVEVPHSSFVSTDDTRQTRDLDPVRTRAPSSPRLPPPSLPSLPPLHTRSQGHTHVNQSPQFSSPVVSPRDNSAVDRVHEESMPGSPGPSEASSIARAKIERQLADGRYKVRTLQEKVLETLQPDMDRAQPSQAIVPAPTATTDAAPCESPRALETPQEQATSPAVTVELQLSRALLLQRWLRGQDDGEVEEDLKAWAGDSEVLPRKPAPKQREATYVNVEDEYQGRHNADGQPSRGGCLLWHSQVDADLGLEAATSPGWTIPISESTGSCSPLSLEQYVKWLEDMKTLVETGVETKECCVRCLQEYFDTLKVGRLAWENPALAVTKAAQPMFSVGTHDDLKRAWDWMSQPVRFLGSFKKSKKTKAAKKVVVFGGGSFATAMAVVAARAQPEAQVVMLLRDEAVRDDINYRQMNNRYLPRMELCPNITAVVPSDQNGQGFAKAFDGAEYAIHCVPVQHSRTFLNNIKDLLPAHVPIIAASKGLERKTGMMMSEIIPEALGRKQPAVFVSGPSFAKEVLNESPTSLVAASKDIKLAKKVRDLLSSDRITISTTTDVIGIELVGALKNVLAIAMGIVTGSDMGDNSRAALLTYGFSEISNMVVKAGGKLETMSTTAGFGDIVLTCYGNQSRNWYCST